MSKSFRSFSTTLLIMTLLASMLLSACTPSAPSGESSLVSTISGSPAKQDIKNAIVGIQQDFDFIDPHLATATGTQEVFFNVFSGLIALDTEGRIIPDLASKWAISDDQQTYTFTLRDDVYFHNGNKMTPVDVKYSIERLMGKTEDQTTPIVAGFASIDSIVTEDAPEGGTVTFNLNVPDAALLGKLLYAIIPADSGPDQQTNPCGAGPFKFISYTPGVNLKLEKFEDYFQEGYPLLDTLEFRIFTNSDTGTLALVNGEIDIFNQTLDQRNALDKNKFTIIDTPQNMPQLLAFNLDDPLFADLRIRQALNHAINKDEIILMIAPGAKKIGTNFSEVMAFYAQEGLENTYPYNPERAQELLKEAGQENLSFTLRMPSEYPFHVETATIIESQLKKIGVEMKIELIEWNTWLEQVYTNYNFQSTLIGLTGKPDPDSVLGRFASTTRSNFMRYKNEEVDHLLIEGKSTANQDDRAIAYKKVQTILADEVPAVFIMDIPLYRAVNKRLTTLPTYPIGFIDMKKVDVIS